MLLEGPLKDPMGLGWPQSPKVIADAQLPRIIQGKRLHFGFVLALAAAVVVWVIMKKTALGYEMRAVGHNPRGGALRRHSGQPRADEDGAAFGRAGGARRLLGSVGLKGNLTLDLSPGFGYSGIVVAMLAMLNPLGVVASAIFVAGIFVGADAMSRAAGVPSYIADVMVATRAARTMVTAMPASSTPLFRREAGRWRALMEALDILFTASFWVAAIRIASPLIFATMGELICERAGVLNLGIEGIMTVGAFAGWFTVYAGGDLWTGVLVAALAGAMFGLLHATLTVPLGLSQHVVGIGITLLATSLTYFIYRLALPEVTSPPKIEPFQPLADPRPVENPGDRRGAVRADAAHLSRLRHRRASSPGCSTARRSAWRSAPPARTRRPSRRRASASPPSAWARSWPAAR